MRDIDEAVQEALKFVACADELKVAIKKSEYDSGNGYTYQSSCPKEEEHYVDSQ
jgi:hypothetical protein